MERPSSELTPSLIKEVIETLRIERPPALFQAFPDQLAPTPVGDTGFFVAGEGDTRVKPLGYVVYKDTDGKERRYRVGIMESSH